MRTQEETKKINGLLSFWISEDMDAYYASLRDGHYVEDAIALLERAGFKDVTIDDVM